MASRPARSRRCERRDRRLPRKPVSLLYLLVAPPSRSSRPAAPAQLVLPSQAASSYRADAHLPRCSIFKVGSARPCCSQQRDGVGSHDASCAMSCAGIARAPLSATGMPRRRSIHPYICTYADGRSVVDCILGVGGVPSPDARMGMRWRFVI